MALMTPAQKKTLAALKEYLGRRSMTVIASNVYTGDPDDDGVIITWGADFSEGVSVEPNGHMEQGGGSYARELSPFEQFMHDWNTGT